MKLEFILLIAYHLLTPMFMSNFERQYGKYTTFIILFIKWYLQTSASDFWFKKVGSVNVSLIPTKLIFNVIGCFVTLLFCVSASPEVWLLLQNMSAEVYRNFIMSFSENTDRAHTKTKLTVRKQILCMNIWMSPKFPSCVCFYHECCQWSNNLFQERSGIVSAFPG